MKRKVIVLGVRRVDFVDRQTGEKIEGVKVHFLDTSSESRENVKGYIPSSAFLRGFSSYDSFQVVPGEYNALLSFELAGNSPKLRYDGFEFVSSVKI